MKDDLQSLRHPVDPQIASCYCIRRVLSIVFWSSADIEDPPEDLLYILRANAVPLKYTTPRSTRISYLQITGEDGWWCSCACAASVVTCNLVQCDYESHPLKCVFSLVRLHRRRSVSKCALYGLFSTPSFTCLWYFLGDFTRGNDLTPSVKTLLVFPSVRRPWWTRWKTFTLGFILAWARVSGAISSVLLNQ